jgi:hypothetical protein
VGVFKDSAGREWRVELDVTGLKRVKAATGVDVGLLFEDAFRDYRALLRDIGRFVDVVWVLVADQAAARGVTDEEFGRALGGDALAAAVEAFQGAVADFYPSRQRAALKMLMAKTRAATDLGHAKTMAGLEALTPEEIWSASATTSPGSPGSIPPG